MVFAAVAAVLQYLLLLWSRTLGAAFNPGLGVFCIEGTAVLILYAILRKAQERLALKDAQVVFDSAKARITNCAPMVAVLDRELLLFDTERDRLRVVHQDRIAGIREGAAHGDYWTSVRVRGWLYPVILRFGGDEAAMCAAADDLRAFLSSGTRAKPGQP